MHLHLANRLNWLLALAVLISCVTVQASGAEATDLNSGATAAKLHRIVFEVNNGTADTWQGVLDNVQNTQKVFGADHVQIEVVAHGAGIGLLLANNTALADRLQAIEKSGPVFAACKNTCAKRNIAPTDLTAGVVLVDGGVAEVVRRQEEGWSYIKP